DLVNAQVAYNLFDAVVCEVTVTAMELQRLICDLEAAIGGNALRHRAKRGRIGKLRIEACGSTPKERPRGRKLGLHVGQLELRVLEVGGALAEGLALLCPGNRRVERALGSAKRAGTGVQTPAIKPRHGALEALPFLGKPIADRNAHVLEYDGRSWLGIPAH